MLRSSSFMVGAALALFTVGCGQPATVNDKSKNSQTARPSQGPVSEEEHQAPADEELSIKPEVMDTNIKLDLPAVPEFAVPQINADGSHPVAEMRLSGKGYLGQEIRLKGTVLWIYDCATALRTPEMRDRDIRKLLANHPERCTRPHFIIGDSIASKTERGIQVVEYPRPIRKDEKSALDKEFLAEMAARIAALPKFKVGDEVIVTGIWSLQSPAGFRNSDGLLTYGSMINLAAPK